MSSGRHEVIIELERSGGPPRGRIRVNGGRQRAFYGWIDLTARLESLTRQQEAEGEAPGDATEPDT